MDINEFIDNLASVFDDTDSSALSPETRFREIDEWSSLIALSIIAMAYDEYEVELSGKDLHDAQTIQDIFDIISSKK